MDVEACEGLVAAARANDRARLDKAITAVIGDVEKYVKRQAEQNFGGLARRKGVIWQDLFSHVSLKLVTAPPKNTNDRAANVAVQAWIKSVIRNYLVDQRDALDEESRGEDGENYAPSYDQIRDRSETDRRRDPEDLLGNELERRVRRMLEHCYSKGLPFYERILADGTPDESALAEELGESRANMQAIRRRVKLYAGAFRWLSEHPRATDEQLVEQMDTTLNDLAKQVIRSVRQFLVLVQRGAVKW